MIFSRKSRVGDQIKIQYKCYQIKIMKNPQSRENNSILDHPIYYHYQNAVYMGPMRGHHRVGEGILLYDNGMCIITSFNRNGDLHGHNVVVDSGRFISIHYENSLVRSLVYRVDGYLLALKYNQGGLLHGTCWLVCYSEQKIYGLEYEKGGLREKKEEESKALKKVVFEDDNLQEIVGKRHSEVLKYQIPKRNNVCCSKLGNKIHVSFVKNNAMNGLGFSFMIRGTHGGYNPETNSYEDDFEMKFIEKGFYKDNLVNGYGQKTFKNGNIYVGGFKNDKFQGEGILKSVKKKNWVYGEFKDGELSQMIDFHNEGELEKCLLYTQKMHSNHKNFQNSFIKELNFSWIDEQLSKMLEVKSETNNKVFEDRKKDMLRKIQNQFLKEQNSQSYRIEALPQNPPSHQKQKQIDSDSNYVKKINSILFKGTQMSQSHNPERKKTPVVLNSQRKHVQIPEQKAKSPTSSVSFRKKQSKSKSEDRTKIFKRTKDEEKSSHENRLIKLHQVDDPTTNSRKKHYSIFEGSSPLRQTERQKEKLPTLIRRSPARKSPIFNSSTSSKSAKPKTSPRSPNEISKPGKSQSINENLVIWNTIKRETMLQKSSIKKRSRKGKIFQEEYGSRKSSKKFRYTLQQEEKY